MNRPFLRNQSARTLLKTIDDNFGTIVFARRYLERLGIKHYHLGMKTLVDEGIVEQYSPLIDVSGSYVAQFEHASMPSLSLLMLTLPDRAVATDL